MMHMTITREKYFKLLQNPDVPTDKKIIIELLNKPWNCVHPKTQLLDRKSQNTQGESFTCSCRLEATAKCLKFTYIILEMKAQKVC